MTLREQLRKVLYPARRVFLAQTGNPLDQKNTTAA
jgi:hypothetical protein